MKKRICIIICLILIVLCTFGYLFAPNDPNLVNLSIRLQQPSGNYPFGTDTMGRCVLSRVLYGGRTTLSIVLFSAIIILIMGVPIGSIMGAAKKKTGFIGDSLLNAATALPPIAYLIVFMGAWGSGAFTTMIAVTLSLFLRVIKLVKSKTEIEYGRAYVLCATASGASRCRVLFVHILPNLLQDVVMFLFLSCADMIMMITSFSFMGLGLGDRVVDWGSMILDAQSVAMMRPHLIIYPIAFVFMCTAVFNILGKELEG
ncbi:ABC transporter permease [Vallitalea sediminicola]